jgi:hypothetical protein
MIKTILVPTSGGSTDPAVFDTALAAARLFSAHLDFCHVRLEAGQALRYVPHAGFASGAALREALDTLGAEGRARSVAAVRLIEEFCLREKVVLADVPPDAEQVSASWSQHDGPVHDHVLTRARHSDLVVMGRDKGANGLPPDLLRLLLLESGRPILVAPPRARPRLTGTVMLCWKEAREPAPGRRRAGLGRAGAPRRPPGDGRIRPPAAARGPVRRLHPLVPGERRGSGSRPALTEDLPVAAALVRRGAVCD